jgi:outer membrane protein TolC
VTVVCLLLAGALWLPGCALKRAHEAKDPNRIPPGERTVTAAEAGLNAETALTVEQAVAIALQYHPAVAQARQNLVIADKQFHNAIAGYLPLLQANVGYQRQTANSTAGISTPTVGKGGKIITPPPSVPTPSNDSHDSWSAGVSAEQLLLDFGKVPFAIRQAAALKRAAEETLRQGVNDLTLQVRLAYYQLSQAQALLKVSEDTVRQYQLHLDQAKALVEVGRRIKNDVTKGEVDLGNAQLNLISAKNAIKTARATLNSTLGLAEEPGYQVVEPPLLEVAPDFDTLLAAARENDPQLRALKDQENAAAAVVNGAVAALFPSISVGGGYSWGGTKFPLVWNWFFGPSLSWNLFDGFRNLRQIDIATAQLHSAYARYAGREQQIYLELSQAVAQLQDAQERLNLVNLIVEQAQENLDLVGELYKVGRASAVEMADAEVSITTARSNQVQARFDYLTAVAQIEHGIGGKKP